MPSFRVQYAWTSLKNDRMISVRFQGKPFNITVIQVYAPTSNAEEVERFYEDLQDLFRTNTQKRCPPLPSEEPALIFSLLIEKKQGSFFLWRKEMAVSPGLYPY